jgi:hypothetical protein
MQAVLSFPLARLQAALCPQLACGRLLAAPSLQCMLCQRVCCDQQRAPSCAHTIFTFWACNLPSTTVQPLFLHSLSTPVLLPTCPHAQAYDRNKFLQANFRFLVSDAVDARKFESDADLMLDWEDVVQVSHGLSHQLAHHGATSLHAGSGFWVALGGVGWLGWEGWGWPGLLRRKGGGGA